MCAIKPTVWTLGLLGGSLFAAGALLSYRVLGEEPKGPEAHLPAPAVSHRGGGSPADKVSWLTRMELDMAKKELLQVITDLRKARVELGLMEAKAKALAEVRLAEEIDKYLDRHPEVVQLEEPIEEQEEILQQYAQTLKGGKDNPLYAAEKRRLEKTRADLNTLRQKLLPEAKERLRERHLADVEVKTASYRDRVAFLKEMEKVLKADIHRLDAESRAGIQSTEQRFNHLDQELQELKEAIRDLKQSLKRGG